MYGKTRSEGGDSFLWVDENVLPATTYHYRVFTFNQAYCGPERTNTSDEVTTSTPKADAVPAQPTTDESPVVLWPEACNTAIRKAYEEDYLRFERSKTPISWATFCEYSRPFASRPGIVWNDEKAWSTSGLADTPEFLEYAKRNPVSLIARCLFAENRNITGDVGQRTVRATATVISNRVRVGWDGQNTLSAVILAPSQFSCMRDPNTGARNPVLKDSELALWCYCVYLADHLYSGTNRELWTEIDDNFFFFFDLADVIKGTVSMPFFIATQKDPVPCTIDNVVSATHYRMSGPLWKVITKPIQIGSVVFFHCTNQNVPGWWECEQPLAKPPVSALSKPTNFSASAISSTEVELRWIYPSSGTSKESGFRLQRREEGGTYQQISEMRKNDPADPNVYDRLRVPGAADSFQWVDRGVVAGKRYEYRLYAYDASHPGPEDANTSNTDAAVVLAPPYNVKAQHVNTIQEDGRQKFHVRVTWDYESGAQDGFKIERWVAEENGFRQKTTTVTADEFEVILTETEPGTVSRYRVRAYNTGESTGTDADDNHSSYSGEASVILPDTQSQATGGVPSDSGSTEPKPQTLPAVQPARPAAAGTSASPTVVDSETLLMEAARADNPELIKRLAAEGADVNAMLENGATALMIAVDDRWANRPSAVRALIGAGASVNIGYSDGRTPLAVAAGLNRLEMSRALTGAGADVNARSNDGWTPLMRAAQTDNPELVKVLASAGADVNARLESGATALVVAIDDQWANRPNAVRALIGAGANVNVGYYDGRTPLAVAAGWNRLEVAKTLTGAGADVNACSNDGWTPLMRAAQTDNPELVNVLAAAGADLNARLENGATALMIAVDDRWADRSNAVRALIGAGANVNIGYYDGRTPLAVAAGWNRLEVAKTLTGAGADVNARSNDGWTPLMRAAQTDNPELVNVLAAAGADLNARLENGATALMIAVDDRWTNRLNAVRVLIGAGANVNIGYYDGRTPSMMAAHWNRPEVVEILDQAGAVVHMR